MEIITYIKKFWCWLKNLFKFKSKKEEIEVPKYIPAIKKVYNLGQITEPEDDYFVSLGSINSKDTFSLGRLNYDLEEEEVIRIDNDLYLLDGKEYTAKEIRKILKTR